MSLSLSLYLQDFVYVAGTRLINSERWRPQTYSGSCLPSGSVQDLFNLTEIYTDTRRWETVTKRSWMVIWNSSLLRNLPRAVSV